MSVQILSAAAALAVSGLFVSAASADEIRLKNGDTLTGKISTLDAGKMTITVLGLGDVKVDVGQIETFSTDGPVDLRLKDGTTELRAVRALPDDEIEIEGGLVTNQRIKVEEINQINPPAPQWTGAISAGALLLRGNTQSDALNLAANLQHVTEQDKIAVTGTYLYGRTKDRKTGVSTTTADNWATEARYDYFFTKKFYGFADAQVSKDRIALLALRFIPSVGVGYKWVDDPDLTFYTEAGVAWVYERYTNNTPVREDVSLHLAYHLTHKFNDKVSVFHDLEYLPSLEHESNFVVNTDLGVHATLSKHFFGEAKITLDYDSNPANSALKTNVWYAINLGYNL